MKNKTLVFISILVLIGLFVGLVKFYNSSKQTELKSFNWTKEPFVREHSISFGENKKNIIVVEFMDPQCHACAVFHKSIKSLYKQYYEDINLVIRYLDNHKNSKFTIKLLEASRKQNKYNEVLEKIFETQDKWAIHNNEKPELLWSILSKIDNLDIQKLRDDVSKMNIDELLNLDRIDANVLNIRGTPTIFVNGKELKKLSANALMDLVEAEIYK